MKKSISCMFTLVLLLGCFNTLVAQDTAGHVRNGCTIAQKGDSLWRIAERELGNPDLWESRLYAKNPELQKRGRRTINPANGWTYVHFLPGEVICGLDELGIAEKPATVEELRAMGFNPTVQVMETTVEKISPWSYIIPLAILLLLAVLLCCLYLYFRRDPTRVGAGRVVETGIHTPLEALAHFRRQTSLPIVSLVRGRGYGWTRVGDVERSFFPRILRGEEIWQVTVRLPEGIQDVRYSLFGCANDVRAGGGMLPGWNFRFEAIENVTEQIRPAQDPPAPVQPAPPVVSLAVMPNVSPTPAPVAVPAPPIEPRPVEQAPATTGVQPNGEFVRPKDAPQASTPPKAVFEVKAAEDGKPKMIRIDTNAVNGSMSEDGVLTLRFTK